VVATPGGLNAALNDSRDPYAWGNDMLFVHRYDLATIMKAVLERNMDSREEEESVAEDISQN